MVKVSTRLTLFLKIIFPFLWMGIFGSMAIISFFLTEAELGSIPPQRFQVGAILFFLIGAGALYWALIPIKHVVMDPEFIYVSNFSQRYRYPYHNIEKIEENDFILLKAVHIYLKVPGNFGEKITFIASRERFDQFLRDNPEVVEQLAEKES